MKLFSKLLCVAVAMLWVLPASALEWNQHARAVLDTMEPELESLQPLSEWIAIERAEFDHFDAADYQVNFQLFNVTLDSTTGPVLIQALDEDGTVLTQSGTTINYSVDDSFVPFVLTISNGTSINNANNFVVNAPMQTRQIRIIPTLGVSVQDCDQQVRMESDLLWADARVATDKPDDLVASSLFICAP